MANEPIMILLERLGEDEQLFQEVAEVAARHGIDLLGGELTEADLDAVAGGNRLMWQRTATSAAIQDGLDSSKSMYDANRERIKLAQSILRASLARSSQVTQRLSG